MNETYESLFFEVPSKYQALTPGKRPQSIRVIKPTPESPPEQPPPTIYVLPVEDGCRPPYQFHDPLYIIKHFREDHTIDNDDNAEDNLHNFALVMPGMYTYRPGRDAHTGPWYGNHSTDLTQQQVNHLIHSVIPKVEEVLNVSKRPQDRLLLGFSKSGWGAGSLLLKYPQVFGFAAAWDAPWCLEDKPKDNWGIWGLQNNFWMDTKGFNECRPDCLVKNRENLDQFKDQPPRLIVTGEHLFGSDHLPAGSSHHSHTVAFRDVLHANGYPFAPLEYHKIPAEHSWNSTWMKPVLELLIKCRRQWINSQPPN